MDLKEIYNLFLSSSGVSTDSREISPNCIFFALKGDSFDGNLYAKQAIENGAKYAVIDNKEIERECSNFIYVKDVLTTLQDLAAHHRRVLGIPIVGLTGTNGKTTTKELISAVLLVKYNVSFTKGNLNNHIGVPLTILKMDKSTQIGVVEMGASAPGDIKLLASISQPNYGLITNVGKAHLLGFGSFDGVKRTKGELYDYLQNNHGTIFYNVDNPHLCEMIDLRNGVKKIPYGINYQNYEILPTTAQFPFVRLKSGAGHTINSSLIGGYNADNIVAALSIGIEMGVNILEAIKAIEKYTPSNNRSQLVNGLKNTLIVDAYNANPTSMRAALENFSKMDYPAKGLIIGDMLELGSESINEHKDILNYIEQLGPQRLFFVGKEFSIAAHGNLYFDTHAKFFETSSDLRSYLINYPVKEMTFLIKGSRGTRLEKVIDAL